MKYKTDVIKNDFETLVNGNEYHVKLRQWLDILDRISVLTGHGEMMMTDFFRSGDRWSGSLHFRAYGGRASDIRVRDKSTQWYMAMAMIGQAFGLLDAKFRMNCHPELYNSNNKHIHIEIRS